LADVSDVITALMVEAVSTSETSVRLHSAKSQKTVIFIFVAVRTWNLAYMDIV
jgi:hypothetical protein